MSIGMPCHRDQSAMAIHTQGVTSMPENAPRNSKRSAHFGSAAADSDNAGAGESDSSDDDGGYGSSMPGARHEKQKKRRTQNAQAQRKYRSRQKAKDHELEEEAEGLFGRLQTLESQRDSQPKVDKSAAASGLARVRPARALALAASSVDLNADSASDKVQQTGQLQLVVQQKHLELERLRRELQHEKEIRLRRVKQEREELQKQLERILFARKSDISAIDKICNVAPLPLAGSHVTTDDRTMELSRHIHASCLAILETFSIATKLFDKTGDRDDAAGTAGKRGPSETESLCEIVQQLQCSESFSARDQKKAEDFTAALMALHGGRAKLMDELRTNLGGCPLRFSAGSVVI